MFESRFWGAVAAYGISTSSERLSVPPYAAKVLQSSLREEEAEELDSVSSLTEWVGDTPVRRVRKLLVRLFGSGQRTLTCKWTGLERGVADGKPGIGIVTTVGSIRASILPQWHWP